MKRCQSCGRLIELLEDFAGLDQESIYCSSCADDDGQIKSFDEVLENLTQRIAKTDGFDVEASRKAAQQILGRQPAWEPKFRKEEGMKTNKRRLALIAVAVVFALSAVGATWWFTSRHYETQQYQYETHLSEFSDPFDDIVISQKGKFKINELRCKGDQEVLSFENCVLNFDCYERNWPIINNNSVINSANNNSNNAKVNESKTFDSKLETYFVLEYGYNVNNSKHGLSFPYKPKVYFGRTSDHVTEIQKNVTKDDYPFSEQWRFSTTNSDNKFSDRLLFYVSSPISVFCFPRYDQWLDYEQFLYMTIDDKVVFKMPLKGVKIEKLDDNGGYIIFKYSKGTYPNEYRYFLILDTKKISYELIPAEVCNFQCISGYGKFLFTDIKHNLIEYNCETKKMQTIAYLPAGYHVKRLILLKSVKYLLLLGENDYRGIERKVFLMNIKTGEIEKLTSDDQGEFDQNIGYFVTWTVLNTHGPDIRTSYGSFSISSELYGSDSGRLYCTNLFTRESTLLDDNVYLSSIKSDGFYIAWTKYAGAKDDQWKNVCWTKIP